MPVIRSKDGTPLDWETTGKTMLRIFKQAQEIPNIFDEFKFLDEREKVLRQSSDFSFSHRKPNYQQFNWPPMYMQQPMMPMCTKELGKE